MLYLQGRGKAEYTLPFVPQASLVGFVVVVVVCIVPLSIFIYYVYF